MVKPGWNVNKKNFFCLLIALLVMCGGFSALAKEETSYTALIIDEAELLNDVEEAVLLEVMKEVDGNTIFRTTVLSEEEESPEIAKQTYREHFGGEDGVCFLVDQGNGTYGVSTMGSVKEALSGHLSELFDEMNAGAKADGYFRGAEKMFLKIRELSGEPDAMSKAHVFEGGPGVETRFQTVVLDEADVLSGKEEEALKECMSYLAGKANSIFVTRYLKEEEQAADCAGKLNDELFPVCSSLCFFWDPERQSIGVSAVKAAKRELDGSLNDLLDLFLEKEGESNSAFRGAEGAFIRAAELLSVNTVPVPKVFEVERLTGTDEVTGYETVIRDEAELLTDQEKQELLDYMTSLTAYGNVAFSSVTLSESVNSEKHAESTYYEWFGNEPGVLLQVDMGNRFLTLSCSTDTEKVLKKERDSIIDNCYRYASKGDYLSCAEKCFGEVETIFHDGKIAHTMKNMNNAILSLLLGLVINFLIVTVLTVKKKGSQFEGVRESLHISEVRIKLLSREMKAKPVVSHSSFGYFAGSSNSSSLSSSSSSRSSSSSSSYSGSSSSSSSSSHSGSSGSFRGGSSSHRF